ncbi:MAG: [protein-PII] uridylyltransferase, partial [Desulfosalsimonadaceae bacterium]|nr:[protein-PII] uridylyltransferase [Desulfosalsimonadaceae bacterium]
NRVVIDNDSSSFFTIIEVFACDFKGLLFNITDVISRLGLNIAVAKVATKVDQVVDVFYVRDESDAKIKDPDFIEKIKSEILSVLPSASLS